MSNELPAAELAARLPVWEALAEFWLDSELVDYQFDYIARAIAASPYSIEEIRNIHDYEVAPAVSANLCCVAGEWSGFDRQWLQERCLSLVARRHSPWFGLRIWLQVPFFSFVTERCWREVLPRVEALRRNAADQPG